jgi:hypothetical protein
VLGVIQRVLVKNNGAWLLYVVNFICYGYQERQCNGYDCLVRVLFKMDF